MNSEEKKPRSEYRSSELKQVVSRKGNCERTDYVDSDGNLTIAADLGFATKVITKNNRKEVEEYFDVYGQKINRYAEYFAVLREYDENGNNIRITFLDANGYPMIMRDGYAIEERIYDNYGKVLEERYFDTKGVPVCTQAYGYGRKNEYNENGEVSCIVFTDEYGKPMMTQSGYGIITRSYYSDEGPENGKVEYEFYYDLEGIPAIQSMGQYGVYKEYNEFGQNSVITYLDAVGKPSATKRGYTTIKRTFKVNGAVATERYYDSDGAPFALSEGQYGINRQGEKDIYLDENGNEQFNIRNLFYKKAYLIIIAALLFVCISMYVDMKMNIILVFLYLGVIGYFTLFYRENIEPTKSIWCFHAYGKILSDGNARAGILKNIWLFIPLGAVLYRLYPKWQILIIAFVLSIFIECIQFVKGIGYGEFDDIISNGLGGIVGFLLVKVLRNWLVHLYLR